MSLMSCLKTEDPTTGEEAPLLQCLLCGSVMDLPDKGYDQRPYDKSFPESNNETNIMVNCDPCKRGNKLDRASFWCNECKDALCEFCVVHHQRMKLSSNHRIVSIEQSDKLFEKREFLKISYTTRREQNMVGVCPLENTKSCCDNIRTRTYYDSDNTKWKGNGDVFKQDKYVSDVIEQLHAIEVIANQINHSEQDYITQIDIRHHYITKLVSGALTNAIDKLKTLHDEFTQNFNTLHMKNRGKVSNRMEKVDCFIKHINLYRKTAQDMLEKGSSSALLSTKQKIKSQLIHYISQLQSEIKKEETVSYSVTINETINQITDFMDCVAEVSTKPELKKVDFNTLTTAAMAFGSTESNQSSKILHSTYANLPSPSAYRKPTSYSPPSSVVSSPLQRRKSGTMSNKNSPFLVRKRVTIEDYVSKDSVSPVTRETLVNSSVSARTEGTVENVSKYLGSSTVKKRETVAIQPFPKAISPLNAVENESIPRQRRTEDQQQLAQATLLTSFTTQVSSCYSGSFFGNGLLMLPDYNYEKLSLYEVRGKHILDHYLYRQPWHVVCISNEEIFVSFPNSLCIKKYRFSQDIFVEMKTIETTQEVKEFHLCCGYLIIPKEMDQIDIFDGSGYKLKSLQITVKSPLFAASRTENKIFHFIDNFLRCCSLDGNEVFAHQCSGMPVALKVDNAGSVYVICEGINIHVLSSSGQMFGQIRVQQCSTSTPDYFGFDPDGQHFFIGSTEDSTGNSDDREDGVNMKTTKTKAKTARAGGRKKKGGGKASEGGSGGTEHGDENLPCDKKLIIEIYEIPVLQQETRV